MRTPISHLTVACFAVAVIVSTEDGLGAGARISAADTGRVEFRIREGQPLDSLRLFEAEYTAGGRTARFAIAFQMPHLASGDMPAVRAALLARQGSDARGLLQALAHIHGGTLSRARTRRLSRLDIDANVLGQALSYGHGPDVIAGRFTSQPRGGWLVLKLFLDTPDEATAARIGEPAEICVALNLPAGRGWFLVKDAEYWPELNRVLASVL